ncbi:MAG: glycoside hydrolase family 9 protein, partial [Candidatus Hydrogenedentes bacterium]|nr:glycoside hydrolase family 9 protein [Candidatus Hydrogenedentota bacterium]
TLSEDQLFDATGHLNVDFFFVQRCGGDVPGWHKPCHLDDAKMEDGSHRDLVGGWHSAGDYNKLVWEYGDGGVMCALITAAEAIPEYFHAKDRDGDGIEDVIEEAQWGADFMKKLMLEDGSLLNHIEQGPDRKTWMNWCPPENTTDNTVGTADDPIVTKGNGNSPLAIAGWARLHRVLTARGIENDYLASAEKLWAKVSNNGANTGDSLLLISTLDLYDVTKNQAYLDYCKASAEALVAQGDPEGQLPGGYSNSGDTPAIALSAFALAFPEDPITQKIKTRLEKHLPFFLKEAQNPLGLMMQQPGPGGYFFEPTSALGCNNQVGMRAWSAVMVYRVLHDQRALRYALDQYDFMLGRNPYGVCMMEGVGSFNPPRQHHRYITIPGHEARGAVPGALVNGFVRDIGSFDRPGMDMSTEGRQYPSYRTNEPWLVHNVLYLLGVTALHEAVEEEAAG